MGVVSDQIGDLLVRIKNSLMARKSSCVAPFSKIKQNILQLLKDEGFIVDFEVDDSNKPKITLLIKLKYVKGFSVIRGLKRVSKPGMKIYLKSQDIKPVRNGIGVWIVSTPKGVMTDADSRKNNLGGEILAEVW